MGKSRGALRVVSDVCYPNAVAEMLAAGARSPEPVRGCVEAMVAMSEPDPKGARAALWRLLTDWKTLRCMERQLGGDPTQAALRIGATIHLARAELARPRPQLRRRLPEMLELLGRRETVPAD